MRVLQVRRDIHLVQRHEHALEVHFPGNDRAQLAFQEFVYAE